MAKQPTFPMDLNGPVDPTLALEQYSFPVAQLSVDEYEEADWGSLRFSREERLRYKPGAPDFAGLGTQPADELERRMLRRLTATFVKGQPVTRPEVLMPASWWQHFKLDVVVPACELLGIRPPKVRTVQLRGAETFYTRACPHIVRRPVREDAHVRFLIGGAEVGYELVR